MQISVQNVTWDLRLKKAYIDGPQCPGGEDMADSAWSSNQEKKTYTDGIINNPNGTGKSSIQEKKKSCKTSFAFLVGILNTQHFVEQKSDRIYAFETQQMLAR